MLAPTAGFSEVRRRFLDSTLPGTFSGGLSISVPWYTFLKERRAIRALAGQYSEPIELGIEARALLEEAIVREREWREGSEPVADSDLLDVLQRNGFKRKLESYQLRNVVHLLRRASGASFSVPGAGKTTEALAVFAYGRGICPRLLVIAPLNALRAWETQFRLCFGSEEPGPIRLIGGVRAIEEALGKDPKLTLTTYGQIVREAAAERIESYVAQHRNELMVVVDESHTFKNPASKARDAVMRIAHLPRTKMILSGTPLPNAIADLVPQFEFLFPEVSADAANIQDRIADVFVRTRKGELRIPALSRQKVVLPMSAEHRRVYNVLSSSQIRQLEGSLSLPVRARLARAGASVQRLLQASTDPVLLLDSLDSAMKRELAPLFWAAGSPKIEWACNRARALAGVGKKTVIWSNFVRIVEIIAERLEDLGAVFIHGAVGVGDDEDDATREGRIRRFHDDPRCFVMVANPLAAAEGISLHEASQHAIYVDRNYNVAKYLQSEDRIHRMGLPPGATPVVEYLFHERTVDESVERRLALKIARMGALLDDPELNIDFSLGSTDVEDGITLEDADDLVSELRSEQ